MHDVILFIVLAKGICINVWAAFAYTYRKADTQQTGACKSKPVFSLQTCAQRVGHVTHKWTPRDVREVVILYVYDTVNAAVTRDAISGVSWPGNPTFVHVSLIDSTRLNAIHMYSCDTHILSDDRQCWSK